MCIDDIEEAYWVEDNDPRYCILDDGYSWLSYYPDGASYALISYSTDGQYDQLGRAGPTSSYDCDIVFSNGDFVQWPGRIRKERIR